MFELEFLQRPCNQKNLFQNRSIHFSRMSLTTCLIFCLHQAWGADLIFQSKHASDNIVPPSTIVSSGCPFFETLLMLALVEIYQM
jgi:hypothetical protein